jgi:acetyl-CoA carboxylase beta subunit
MTVIEIMKDYETFNNASYDEYLRIKRDLEDLFDYENIVSIKGAKQQKELLKNLKSYIQEQIKEYEKKTEDEDSILFTHYMNCKDCYQDILNKMEIHNE